MARVILPALAVIAAVLGYLMDNVLLLGIAGAFLLLALFTLIALAVKRRRRRAASERQRDETVASRESELRSLGISDIRPKQAVSTEHDEPPRVRHDVGEDGWNLAVADDFESELDPEAETAVADEAWGDEDRDEVAYADASDADPSDGELADAEEADAEEPLDEEVYVPRAASTGRRVEPVPVLQSHDDSPFWRVHSPTAINSYLRALWAATEVQSVALFSSDRSGNAYTLEAALSHSPAVRREGRFAAADHLASHVSLDRPITVLEENDPLIRALPYYRQPVHVGGVAVLPVRDEQDQPVFLVVDLASDQVGFTERQRTLLLSYAGLLGTMLAQPEDAEANLRSVPTRRSIIAEEMSRARAQDHALALALVYRADAEEVAEDGADAVAAAERELRLHLEDHPHHGRVERFGEQMYGVFLHEEVDALEAWADDVRDRAAEKGIPLAIGVAQLGERHADADALRADAANALQEAFAAQEPVVIA